MCFGEVFSSVISIGMCFVSGKDTDMTFVSSGGGLITELDSSTTTEVGLTTELDSSTTTEG